MSTETKDIIILVALIAVFCGLPIYWLTRISGATIIDAETRLRVYKACFTTCYPNTYDVYSTEDRCRCVVDTVPK